MATGFNSPSILFLNTSEGNERGFIGGLLAQLREKRGYVRYVEACAGAWVMPTVAREAGFTDLVGTDVNLFSAVLGKVFAGEPFDDLEIKIDGEPFEAQPGCDGAAEILYLQLLARMQQRPEAEYWDDLVHDLTLRGAAHVASIAAKLRQMNEKLHGASFVFADPFETLERFGDEEHTIIGANPPTYKGAYEKFFDTSDRLTWRGPTYELWDGAVDVRRLVEQAGDTKALLLVQEQKAPRAASHAEPVYARHISRGQYCYVVSNRPDEVFGITGGMKVKPRSIGDIGPVDWPLVPADFTVGLDTRVAFEAIAPSQSAYYKEMWLRRVTGDTTAGFHFGVLLDGHFAGLAGVSTNPITHQYPGMDPHDRVYLLIRYACGAPHEIYRLSRLVTMLCCSRRVLEVALPPAPQIYVTIAEKVQTIEMTRHPEAKSLRGIMKLRAKHKDPKDGYRLMYAAPINDDRPEEVLAKWLMKEQRWQTARAQ